MKFFIEFIVDFWRELIFGTLLITCILLVLGYQSRGDEITTLKSEVSELRSGQSSVIDTPVADEVQTQEEEQEIEQDIVAEPEGPYLGFSLKDSKDWVFSEGDQTSGYTFRNGTRTVDIKTSPNQRVVGSDIQWLFDVRVNEELDTRTIALTDTNETFCVSGQDNCTFGDGTLQILVNQNIGPDQNAEIQLFFSDTEYVSGEDESFNLLKNFISLVELN